MRRVALYGGSFDPFHISHQLNVTYTLALAKVDSVIVAPCYKHAFEKKLVDFNHRMTMAAIGTMMFGTSSYGYNPDKLVTVSDIEKTIAEEYGVNYTIYTVERLLKECDTVVLVLGSDIAKDLPKWMHYDRLKALEEAGKLEFFFINRNGFALETGSKVQMPSVSSTEVRARIRANESIDDLVPSVVANYIKKNNLYLDY